MFHVELLMRCNLLGWMLVSGFEDSAGLLDGITGCLDCLLNYLWPTCSIGTCLALFQFAVPCRAVLEKLVMDRGHGDSLWQDFAAGPLDGLNSLPGLVAWG